jgi:competence protein ComEA
MPDVVSLLRRLRSGEEPQLAVALLVAAALLAGFFWYWAGRPPSSASAAALPAAARPPAAEAPPDLVVHVAGAVLRPGLHRLRPGARVADAVDAAGGAAPGADVDRLNLAGKLADGQRVAVPRRGEPAPTEPGGSSAEAPAVVDLNTATEAELDTLPGIGPTTARAIVEERTRRGGFRSLRDLLRIRGIGERRLAELRPRLQV